MTSVYPSGLSRETSSHQLPRLRPSGLVENVFRSFISCTFEFRDLYLLFSIKFSIRKYLRSSDIEPPSLQ